MPPVARTIDPEIDTSSTASTTCEPGRPRTVPISNLGIPTAKFDLTVTEKNDLWASGVKRAEEFMVKWGATEEGFAKWKDAYRTDVEEAQREFARRYGMGTPA